MEFNFYTKNYNENIGSQLSYPCFVFIVDGWNDYGYYTLFKVYYYSEKSTRVELGDVKILDITDNHTYLPGHFHQLESNFYSLGQSLEFYLNLKEIAPDSYVDVLACLNDIAMNPELSAMLRGNEGFNESLIRFSSAENAYNDARLLLVDNMRRVNEKLTFSYSVKLPGAISNHEVKFDFIANEDLPFRVNVIIGKNGTGKTQFLGSLVNSISGVKKRNNKFEPYNPLFNKVIAISYSLFDDFPKPADTTVFSYKYIGLRSSEEELVSDESLGTKLRSSLTRILESDRSLLWYTSVQSIIQLSDLGLESHLDLTSDWINLLSYKNAKRLSSGQSIILFILTELIANITNESLILFDEPETHLHPSAIGKLLKCMYAILEEYDSFSIISTHSPLIIQDVPSNYITIFDRQGNTPIVRGLQLESFGESISVLTKEVFGTIETKSFYKEYFELLSDYSIDKIESLFNNDLSINAQLYIESLKSKE